MASSSTQNGSIVDFNTAMENFVAMFPELSTSQIEKVLRQNNGDVELTINDLLKLGNNCVEKQPPRRESATSCSTSSTHRNSCMSTANNHCEDDEKIALMLQNREFLRYLRSNDRFLRELDSDQHDYYPRQRHESVLSRCKRKEYGSWTMHEPPPMNPQDYEKCALP
ncbi:CUE domain-containing protein [Aphelenchoides bicaudatus]|nr:CUE domain-containing protein [Aphelenchoides bicaudatus]